MSNDNRKHNDPYRHHVVPKHYLNAFAIPDDNNHIWQYELGAPINNEPRTSNPKHTPIKKAGMQEHFYSVSDENGVDSVTFEKELQKRENKYLPSLVKLRSVKSIRDYQDFLSRYRQDFVECIIIMNQRGFKRRDLMERMFAAIEGDPRFPKLDKGKRSKLMHESMLHRDQKIRDILCNNSWIYFRAPEGKKFITSDSPVYAQLGGLGMVAIPVSPRYVLLIANQDKYGSQDDLKVATEETWSDFNHMMADGAVKYLYHGHKEEWVSLIPRGRNVLEENENAVRELIANFDASEGINI